MSAIAAVDLDAIATSVGACVAATRRGGAGPAVMAVVKADGYGHGMVPAARAALGAGASWLGVASVREALALRAGGVTAPVLSWLNPPGEAMGAAILAGVDLAASAPWAVQEMAAAARGAGVPARVHLKADTGLARGGAAGADWSELVIAAAAAAAEGTVEVVGIMSHLVHGDNPDAPETTAQIHRFEAALAEAARHGVHPQLRHLANSGATLSRPDTHFDLVRPGIACYGLSPFPALRTATELGLVPAMTVSATLALTKRVSSGQGVSYGHRWQAPRETTLALVPLGYADGVPRAATNVAEVLLAGNRRPIAGTVCMDQFVVDAGDSPVAAGDRVVLFGPGHQGEPTAQDWADWLGTISYEIVTRVGARVPRSYTGEAG